MNKIRFALISLFFLAVVVMNVAMAQESRRDQLEGLVYEVEDWTKPKDSLKLNQPGPNNWQIWTKEEDVVKKRSNGASVTTPTLPSDADRNAPEDGAPVLTTKITGIPAGTYRVYMNNTNRPLALSFDGGKTWEKTQARSEEDFGMYTIKDGTFELQVDDRFACPTSRGWAYYDYIRFVPTDKPTTQIGDIFLRGSDEYDQTARVYWTTTVPTPPATLVFKPKSGEKNDKELKENDKELKEVVVKEPDSGLRNHKVEIPSGALSNNVPYQLEIRVPINRSGDAASETVDWKPMYRPVVKQTQSLRLPLTVAEPTETGRKNWPVTSGVPFAQGVLADTDCLRLENADGKKIKTQFTPTAYWPDGTVQWLTVDFLADTSAPDSTGVKTPSVYTLVLEPRDDNGLSGLLAGGCINADGFIPVSSKIVLADGRKLSMNGCRYYRNYSPNVETKGVFIQEGLYSEDGQTDAETTAGETTADEATDDETPDQETSDHDAPGLRWRLEYYEYDDTDIGRVRWTIGNNLLDEQFALIKSASVSFTDYETEKLKPYSLSVLQDTLNHATVTRDGRQEEVPRFDGFVSTGNQAVLFDKFWQTWPKGLAVTQQKEPAEDAPRSSETLQQCLEMVVKNCPSETIEYQILPELPKGYSADVEKNKRDNLIQNYFWMKDDCYRFKRGMEITVDIWTASAERAAEDPTLAEHLKRPLFAACTPEYYCSTGVFPPVNPVRPGTFDAYEKAFNNSFANHLKGRQERGEYGWMSFGDWFGERTNNWGNNEYDMSYMCAMQFARSGNLAVLERGIEMARHYTTVDFRRYQGKNAPRERMYLHCFGHVNGFFEPGDPRLEGLSGQASEQDWWFRSESDSSGGHAHQPGNFYIGHLTGDPDILAVGRIACDAQAKLYTPNFRMTIERAAGWPLANAVYAYRFTNDPYYLNAARLFFETIQQKQNPETGCFDLPQDLSECDCPDKKEHRGGKAFAVGVLMHALARYYESEPEPARKEAIKTVIVRCADWLLDYSWNEEKFGFRYKTGCPKYQDTGWYSILVIEGLAYASEISGNERYIEFLKRTLYGPIQGESNSRAGSGKDFSQKHRQSAHALYWLEKRGVREFEKP